MWVVLCDPADHAALWAYAGLRDRGLTPLRLVSPQALVCSTWSAHRIETRSADFEIRMPDGDRLASSDIRGLLNRLSAVPTGHIVFSAESERRYASEEINALVLSWLACIGPAAVNRPSPRGIGGAWRSPAEWSVLAARAGLPTAPLRLSSHGVNAARAIAATRSLIVLGDRVFGGELPPNIAHACTRLARLADADLLGIELHVDRGQRLLFGGASPLPDLRLGGRAFIDALYLRFGGMEAGSS
jgi:hypothetical protein